MATGPTAWDEHGMPIRSAPATAWDEKGNPIHSTPQQVQQPVSSIEQQGQIPENYGFTLRNIGQNVKTFAQGAGAFVADLVDPRTPWIGGPDSVLSKYLTTPMAEQGVKARVAARSGNYSEAAGHAAAAVLPVVGPIAAGIGEQAGTGDIGGAATQAGLQLLLARAGKGNPAAEGAEEGVTAGMAKGGPIGAIEKLANRFPVVSKPLSDAYAKVAESFRGEVADAVEKTSGVKGDPTNLPGTLADGAMELKNQAKAAYKPVDDFVNKNSKQVLDYYFRQIGADPDIAASLPPKFADHPIMALKQVEAALNRKGQALLNSDQGIAARDVFNRAQAVDTTINQIVNGLPEDIAASYEKAEGLYARGAAMADIADTFNKKITGLPPAKQAPGIAVRPQEINAGSLIEALKDNRRFAQAFGEDTAQAILERADRLGVAQALKGGSGKNLGGMLLGAGMLLHAFTGSISMLGPELGGMWVLSKVLASPPALPFYANMLRATTVGQQDFWARMAISRAIPTQNQQLPQQPVSGGATIGQQLQSKGIQLQMGQPNQPGLPFNPNAGKP